MADEQVAKNAPTESDEQEHKTTDERPEGEIKNQEVLYSIFDIDKYSAGKETEKKVDYIYDYLKDKAESVDDIDLSWELKSLQRKLGTPRLGEAPIHQVYEYIKIKSKAEHFTKMKEEMEDV